MHNVGDLFLPDPYHQGWLIELHLDASLLEIVSHSRLLSPFCNSHENCIISFVTYHYSRLLYFLLSVDTKMVAIISIPMNACIIYKCEIFNVLHGIKCFPGPLELWNWGKKKNNPSTMDNSYQDLQNQLPSSQDTFLKIDEWARSFLFLFYCVYYIYKWLAYKCLNSDHLPCNKWWKWSLIIANSC